MECGRHSCSSPMCPTDNGFTATISARPSRNTCAPRDVNGSRHTRCGTRSPAFWFRPEKAFTRSRSGSAMKWQLFRTIMATSLPIITASRKPFLNASLASRLLETLPHPIGNNTHQDQLGDKELTSSVEQLAPANRPSQKVSALPRPQYNGQHRLVEEDADRSAQKTSP